MMRRSVCFPAAAYPVGTGKTAILRCIAPNSRLVRWLSASNRRRAGSGDRTEGGDEISSRSNCANESRMFSVSRPSDVLVLNCWVTATKLTLSF